MDGISLFQGVLFLALCLVVLGGNRFLDGHAQETERVLSQLQHELMSRTPVFSAETTKHDEAQLIRDRLPSRWSAAIVFLVVALMGALLWLLIR